MKKTIMTDEQQLELWEEIAGKVMTGGEANIELSRVEETGFDLGYFIVIKNLDMLYFIHQLVQDGVFTIEHLQFKYHDGTVEDIDMRKYNFEEESK